MDFWFTLSAESVKSPVFILTSDGEEKIKKITLPARQFCDRSLPAEPALYSQNPRKGILYLYFGDMSIIKIDSTAYICYTTYVPLLDSLMGG
ncbi:MAG: hypothetical protein RIQ41_444 [Candidatus Parcubacteria bacterium]|jgi:hypothetical protein